MVARLPVALALGLLLGFVPPALANHPQTAHGDVLVFDHRTGNEWWVEVVLSGGASGSVSSVQAMDTGGSWVAMSAHPEWAAGDWAASFHVEPGHAVRFRAAWTGGDQVESCWFTHPAGVEQCGTATTTTTTASSTTSTSGGGFDATFSSVKGNEWWVESKVAANQPLAGVDARVNCGSAWHALTLREWGAWAASFNIPSGSKVDLRARSTSGATDFSQGYVWPQATLTTSCATEPVPFDATFSNVKGNEWWVQASVSAAGGTLSRVDVRVDRSPWMPLAKQSWGGWAASYHLTPGATLQIRATSSTGAVDLSGCYLWTLAQPIGCAADWPVEGTFLRYEGRYNSFDLSHGIIEESWTNVTTTYTGGDWRSTCTEHYLRFEGSYDTPSTDTTTTTTGTITPRLAIDTPIGSEASMWLPKRCGIETYNVQRENDGYYALVTNGQLKTVGALDFRQTSEEYNGEDVDVRADRQQGLLLLWQRSYANYLCECYSEGVSGRVVDTNIPLGPVLSREQQKAMMPAWPASGSQAVYAAYSQDPRGWHNETYVQLAFDGSAWQGTCELRAYAPGSNPNYGPTVYRKDAVSFAPMKGATMPAQGSLAAVTLLRDCRTVAETMRVRAPEAYETYALQDRDDFYQVAHVEAAVGDEDPDEVGDEDAWWDPETGLLLEWNWDHGGDVFYGRLLQSDAPVR